MVDEKQVAALMKSLKISREEALDVIAYDEDVKKDRKTEYDLTPEQMKNVQEMNRRVDHKKSGPRKVERKPNETKEAIIVELTEFLREDAQGQPYEDVEITNKNRMIHFKIGEKEFDLQLIEKRPPKTK